MSSRSIIAVQYGDGFRGRYCHAGGYPTHNGKVLFEEVRAAGVGSLEAFLSEDSREEYVIEFITSGFLTADRVMPWTPANSAMWIDSWLSPTVFGGRPSEPPTSWITPDDTYLWCTEWCYVASTGGLTVGAVREGGFRGGEWLPDSIKWIGFYGWHQTPDWEALDDEGDRIRYGDLS